MKRSILLTVVIILSHMNINAQPGGTDSNNIHILDPLESYAFTKMMYKEFNYVVSGNNTPVTGFKLETAKPSLTLTGNLYERIKYSENGRKGGTIINLQLKGGLLNDNLTEIFSNKKLSGSFQTTLGINFFGKFRADYIRNLMLKSEEPIQDFNKRSRELEDIFRTDIANNRERLSVRIDSFAIIKTLIEEKLPEKLVDFCKLLESNYALLKLKDYNRGDSSAERKKLAIKLISSFGATGKTDDEIYLDFRKLRYSNMIPKLSELVELYNNLKIFNDPDAARDLQADYAINADKDIWVRKQIVWINISPQIANSSLTLIDTLTNILKDTNSLSYGLNVSVNVFNKYRKNRFLYFKGGGGINRSNNLYELNTEDYKKTSALPTTGTDSVSTEKAVTAYKGQLTEGWSPSLFVEFYYTPLKKIPLGIYAESKYSYLQKTISPNKLSLNLGLVWNVLNNDSESKNVLTIIPYVAWSNLLKQYSDYGKTKVKTISDLFSIGIKFGVPINIGKE